MTRLFDFPVRLREQNLRGQGGFRQSFKSKVMNGVALRCFFRAYTVNQAQKTEIFRVVVVSLDLVESMV